MSGVEAVIARVGEIESRITSLDPAARAAQARPAAAPQPATTGAAQFATALDAATQPRATAPIGVLPPTVTAPPLAGDGSVTGTAVVEQAEKYLGVPYVFGGEDETGMDCSGLVQRVFADLGVDVPRVVQDQADVGVEVPSLDQAQPGDLIIPHGEGHIVIYIGDGKVLHAPRPGKDVQIVDNFYGPGEIATIRRVVPADSEVAVTAPPVVAQAAGAPASATGDAELIAAMQAMFAARTSGAGSSGSMQSLAGLLA